MKTLVGLVSVVVLLAGCSSATGEEDARSETCKELLTMAVNVEDMLEVSINAAEKRNQGRQYLATEIAALATVVSLAESMRDITSDDNSLRAPMIRYAQEIKLLVRYRKDARDSVDWSSETEIAMWSSNYERAIVNAMQALKAADEVCGNIGSSLGSYWVTLK